MSDYQVAFTALGAAVGSAAAIVATTWKFRDWVDEKIDAVKGHFTLIINEHEKVDQSRHLDNLHNFTDIRIQMVALRTGAEIAIAREFIEQHMARQGFAPEKGED